VCSSIQLFVCLADYPLNSAFKWITGQLELIALPAQGQFVQFELGGQAHKRLSVLAFGAIYD
jgi:hypothetical protein